MDQKDSSYDNTADSSVVSASPKHSTRTRFLLLSDTHSHPLHPTGTTEYAYRSPLSHADVLIHAGDLSFSGRIEQYRRTLDVIKASDAELKLVIAGNHDLTLDEAYTTHQYVEDEHQRHEVRTREMRVLDEARGLWTGQAAREAGVVYLEEGLRKFTLRNGTQFTVSFHFYCCFLLFVTRLDLPDSGLECFLKSVAKVQVFTQALWQALVKAG